MNIVQTIKRTLTIPSNYSFTFTDDSAKKSVQVLVNCGPGKPAFSFVLWSGLAYAEAGDYTQAQLNTAVAAYLASLTTAA
jgi:hypothetical protein